MGILNWKKKKKIERAGVFFEEPQHKGRSGGALWIPNALVCPFLTPLPGRYFSALRSELHVQGSHEYPQHALHWPLHRRDGPEINRLQAQGRCCRRRVSWPLCVCACVRGSCEEKEEVKLFWSITPPVTELDSCSLDWSLIYLLTFSLESRHAHKQKKNPNKQTKKRQHLLIDKVPSSLFSLSYKSDTMLRL